MLLNIYKDYQSLSLHTAEEILATVKSNPTAVLCFATGDSPRLTYELMVKKAQDEKVDFTRCTFIGLDEWVGIPPQYEGSCRLFLESYILGPLHIPATQVYLFDSMSPDPEAECRLMDKAIAAKGGIDLMLVGVGMNGHIGFNEPGVSADLNAHVINLDHTTQSVGQKYFTKAVTLSQGITLGLKQVMQSKKLIMVASGNKKAEVIHKAMEEEINSSIPAGILRTHLNGWVMIDKDAAAFLNLQTLPKEIIVNHYQ